jgi:triosephosphate isomerase
MKGDFMRVPIIAGNWKMYKTTGQAVHLVRDLWRKVEGIEDVEIVVCPPFTSLRSISTMIEADRLSVLLGAQNMHWEEEGAYTGEISPLMLTDLNVRYVIIGHSERREHFGETDEMVNGKVKSALGHGLRPIMCVGETLDERDQGRTEAKVEGQVKAGLAGVSTDGVPKVVIAYEPIWAIGTGRSATAQDANDVIKHIRATIGAIYGPELAQKVRIQYGGSVKPENAALFMKEPDIDGALVGGASLEAESFAQIVMSARGARVGS